MENKFNELIKNLETMITKNFTKLSEDMTVQYDEINNTVNKFTKELGDVSEYLVNMDKNITNNNKLIEEYKNSSNDNITNIYNDIEEDIDNLSVQLTGIHNDITTAQTKIANMITELEKSDEERQKEIISQFAELKKEIAKDVSNVLNRVRRDRESNNRKRSVEYSRTAYNEYPKNPLYHKFSDPGLLPCPFCGGEDILLQNQYSQKVDGYYCMVVCNVCGARTRSIKNDNDVNPNTPNFWKSVVIEQVKALWNTRV